MKNIYNFFFLPSPLVEAYKMFEERCVNRVRLTPYFLLNNNFLCLFYYKNFEKKMKQIESFNKQLEKSTTNLDRKIIYYEDYENWDETIADVLKYLNVKDIPLKAASKKLNPHSLEEMIGNYAEVETWLNANGYNKYLD